MLCVLIVFLITTKLVSTFQPITLLNTLNPFCYFSECCTEKFIPANFNKLEEVLHERVYGQHLALDIVVNALKSHWDSPNKPQKALTLSFHGWPGSGKNYISKFILENLYKFGSKSNFVHHFIGRIHFPLAENVEKYQEYLRDFLKTRVKSCERQLFIFDEVDKMPPKLLNIIKPMIDYREDVEGVDFRQTVFIFLSNTGASLINEHVLYLWKQGVKREDLRLKDFEKLIAQGAFNEEGGFQYSDAIKSNLIDHYIPFLPMEERHVKLCILDEFKQRGINNPTKEQITEAMDFIDWGPESINIYSKTGCKRLSQKVGMIAAKNHKLKLTFNEEL